MGEKQKLSKKAVVAFSLAPALIILLGVFLIPMAYMFIMSFQNKDMTWSFANYLVFVKDPFYLQILWRTLRVSLWTVFFCVLLGFPVAMYMAKASPKVRGLITFLIISPHLISVVIRNFGWVVILGDRGFVNNTLIKLGLIEKPLRLLYNEIGVVIGLTDAFIVYMVLAIATSLYSIDQSLYKAADILGASKLRSFFTVTLPLTLPGLISGTILVFSLSMSAFVTPALMGGTSMKTMPVIAYEQVMTTLNWSFGSALAFVLLGFTIGLVTLFTKLIETKRYKEVFSG